MAKIAIPDIKEILTTGLQFGHNTARWNPKMSKFIFGAKNNVHVIDVVQTRQLLEETAEFLQKKAEEGEVIFVATKKQAEPIVKQAAIDCGAHFVVSRWAGGLLTNFDVVQRSLKRLNQLEKMFEEGVEGRTKYEVTVLKSEWERLSRLYEGVKTMEKLPVAMVVVDPRYERVAVKEARLLDIPVIGLVDTNCDPEMVDYPIPGNDDALRSIELVIKAMSDAVKAGNKGKGVEHKFKDYSAAEVELTKATNAGEEVTEVAIEASTPSEPKPVRVKAAKPRGKRSGKQKGILERVQDESKKKPKK